MVFVLFLKSIWLIFLVESQHVVLRKGLQLVHSIFNKLTIYLFNSYIQINYCLNFRIVSQTQCAHMYLFQENCNNWIRESLFDITSWFLTSRLNYVNVQFILKCEESGREHLILWNKLSTYFTKSRIKQSDGPWLHLLLT